MSLWELLDPIYDPADEAGSDAVGLDADTVRELGGLADAAHGRPLLAEETDAGR